MAVTAVRTESSESIRLLLVEDHPLMRESIKRVFSKCCDIEIVAEVGTGADALSALERVGADVVLLDLRLPDSAGLDVLHSILDCHGSVAVIILTAVRDNVMMSGALRAGAQAYLLKGSTGPELLAETVRGVRLGLVLMDPEFLRTTTDHCAVHCFGDPTTRERQVWLAIASGRLNAEIAEDLGISPRTVKFHIGNLFAKTGAHTRSELVALAYRVGLAHQDGC